MPQCRVSEAVAVAGRRSPSVLIEAVAGEEGWEMMAGLKKIADQNKFRRKAALAAEKIGLDVDLEWQVKSMVDDAYEDDGNLHIERHGLHLAIGFGQDSPGKHTNEQIRAIMSAVGLKRKIGKRVLVEEECETCDGDGYITCGECSSEHGCDECDGNGFTKPEDYK